MPNVEVFHGDCGKVLKSFPDESIDLIVTSPPYADRRKSTYGGVHPEKYVAWFIERSEEFFRVLQPSGSFVLNIKEKAENGERHTYVLELILALRQQGWLWTEEYIWHKRNCYPGKWPNRFRDAWERCLHFTKARKFKMNQQAVMVPMGDWADARLKSLGKNDVVRFDSQVGSGFGKNIANWLDRPLAYPTNVLHLATECGNKNHSAAFPQSLPEWFIKLLTDPGDTVLDPFVGSGTTLKAAHKLGRHAMGIDALEEYCEMSRQAVGAQLMLLQKTAPYGNADESPADRVHQHEPSPVPRQKTGKSRKTKTLKDSSAQESVPVQGKAHRDGT
jgi:DNA modification methylase